MPAASIEQQTVLALQSVRMLQREQISLSLPGIELQIPRR